MLIKVALIVALIVLGAVNRRRVDRRGCASSPAAAAPGAAGRLLRRTLRAEVALVLVVLGVTAALVSYPPPDSLAGGPFSGSARLGPLRLEATLDPARVGPNELHLYVLRASRRRAVRRHEGADRDARAARAGASGRCPRARARPGPATTSSTPSSSCPAATGGCT